MSYALELRSNQRTISTVLTAIKMPEFLTGTSARVVIVAATVFLVIGYIVQIGVLSTSGYEIATLERQVDALGSDTAKLTSKLASYQAINSVEKRLEPGSMVPASNIKYIKVTNESAVAAR